MATTKQLIAQHIDLSIPTLGPATVPSPLGLSLVSDDGISDYTADDARVSVSSNGSDPDYAFQLAGARAFNFFKGDEVAAGIVTCGGLCPGMNNVIRGLVMQLWHAFGVRRIVGFRYGFRGLTPDTPDKPRFLTPDDVKDIHVQGGTVLGSSRGPQRPEVLVDTLQKLGINVLFCIGGDGSMRGALALYEEITRRGATIAIVGVPKTIDNDLPYIERTFGFDTAVSRAADAIKAAHVEAVGAPNGIGVVRLMGRHSGFIAASATLASGEVNLLLVPELPFDLEGERGVLSVIRQRIQRRGHCVVVVAEGAGQRHLEQSGERDASGNVKLSDIGVFLSRAIKQGLREDHISLKYIDPSYIVRAAPANAGDAIFCGQLAEEAVHAAMAGKTGMVMGLWLNRFTHVPLRAVCAGTKRIDLDSSFWRNTIEATGQPRKLTA
ncbi:MAG: ATP-dependent 6-phosphofructokinase [Pseudomonadota bacterium]